MKRATALRRANLLPAIKATNRMLRRLTGFGHRLQFETEWMGGTNPEWFDHLIDQHWKWTDTRNSLSWERGFFSTLAMSFDCTVLDLCCGGGFFSHHFYSGRAEQVVAVDFDPSAIAHAQANFKAPNVRYVCADIRGGMPIGDFTNVVWDAAIEHFTQDEMIGIFDNIKARLAKANGVLSGYTIIERSHGKSLEHHEYEFKSREELADLLKRFFAHVAVIQTTTRDYMEVRDNLYFFASDGQVPFGAEWDKLTIR